DSTRATTLDPTATLATKSLSLGSGQISLALGNSSPVSTGSGLVLSGATLQGLQTAQSLSLLSYSTIDIYGSGQIGGRDSSGQPTLANFALRAGSLRGFDSLGGSVTFSANNILLDNAAGARSPVSTSTAAGALVFNATTVRLGANALGVE